MHFNNSNFSDSQLTSPNQTDLVCLVLTEFPEKTVLAKIKDQIQQNCGFVQKVIIPNHSEIQCYFQSMTDLIELDQGRKYGAGRAFIRDLSYAESNENFQSESEVKDGVFQNSKQTFYSDESNNIPSLRFIPSFNVENIQNTKLDEKLLHIQKMTRLTSLQDQVEELEHWREELNLFEQSFDNNVTVETDGIKKNVQIVYSHHTQPLTEILLYSGKKQSQIPNQKRQCEEEDSVNTQKNENKKQAIISLVEGAVLAGIMYGGVRLLKSFFR